MDHCANGFSRNVKGKNTTHLKQKVPDQYNISNNTKNKTLFHNNR